MRISKLVVALLVLGCAPLSFGQDVHVDWDKHATFERYHTYCWGKVQTSNPLWKNRIQDAVDKDLQAKGWQRVDSHSDATIFAVGSTQNQQEYQTFYNGLGGGWRWGGFAQSTTTVENYRVGTLVVDLYDSNNRELLFRGTASDSLSSDPDKNERKLEKAVDKMFKKFPPEKE
jgi:hypothetical protein